MKCDSKDTVCYKRFLFQK